MSKLPKILALIAIVLLTSADNSLLGERKASAQVVEHPNFVVVMTDDLDTQSMKHLDGIQEIMGSTGTTFENAYVTYAWCCPSRATFLRGQYPHNHEITEIKGPGGGEGKFRALGLDHSTLATWLDDAGYQTKYIGKYMNDYKDLYVPPGWDEWFAFTRGTKTTINKDGQYVTMSGHSTDVFADRADDFIRRSSTNPFFVVVGTKAPHSPPEIAERHINRFANAQLPRPPNFDEEDISDKPQWLQSRPRLSQDQIDRMQSLYRDRLRSMLSVEDLLRQIVATLQDTGELSNTYIIFTSDNGFHMGHHRLAEGKQTAYEEDIGVPLIVRGPGMPEGAVRQQLIVNNDFAPTVADLAGVPTPAFVDGRSFAPLLAGSVTPTWREAFLEEGWLPQSPNLTDPQVPTHRSVHTTEHLLEKYDTGEYELYDLVSDPYQRDSKLRSDNKALYSNLEARLEELKNCAGDACREAEFGQAALGPETAINSGPSGYVDSSLANFTFSSSVPGSTFQCSLNGVFLTACSSPQSYTDLADGEHTFFVQAIDPTGSADPSAASRTWTVDTMPPTVAGAVPEDGRTGIGVEANVAATFSEGMDPSTITSSNFTLFEQGSSVPVPAAVTYDPASKKATLDPGTRLKPGTVYTAGVKGGDGGVEDLSGKPLSADETWSFTTRSDIVPPAIRPPEQGLTSGGTLGTSAVPVKLTWSASDGESGINAYQVQQSTDGAAYTDSELPSAASTTKTVRLLTGKAYRFRVRASDGAHNWSEWAYGESFFVNAHQETSNSASYTGTWANQMSGSSYGGTVKYADEAGAKVRFAFTGSDVAWIAPKGPDKGKAEVWLNGTKAATLDLYSPASQARKVMFAKDWDSSGSHVLEIRVLGSKRAPSTGTRVDVDGFVVLR